MRILIHVEKKARSGSAKMNEYPQPLLILQCIRIILEDSNPGLLLSSAKLSHVEP